MHHIQLSTSSGWFSRLCLFKFVLRQKLFWHLSHLKARSPVCESMWVSRICFLPNDLPHRSHMNDRAPVCFNMCAFKWCLILNFSGHKSHWCFLISMCPNCKCVFRWCSDTNFFLHLLHGKFLLFAWISIWVSRDWVLVNNFEQTSHLTLRGFFLAWTASKWRRRSAGSLNTRGQCQHCPGARSCTLAWIWAHLGELNVSPQ